MRQNTSNFFTTHCWTKIRHFLISLTLILFMGATPALGAGYSCPSYMKYTSCNANYYMTYNGSYNGTARVANACTACPSTATYCPGGTDAPIYKITINANNGTAGTTTAIYRSASAGFCSAANANCVADGSAVITTVSGLPTRTNYALNGLYSASSGGTQYVTSAGAFTSSALSTTTSTATWYAQWTSTNISVTCSGGKYIAKGATTCSTTCPTGYYCPSGTYTIPATGATAITGRTSCSENTYNSSTGASASSACKSCPSNYGSSAAASTSINSCYKTLRHDLIYPTSATSTPTATLTTKTSVQTTYCYYGQYCELPDPIEIIYDITGVSADVGYTYYTYYGGWVESSQRLKNIGALTAYNNNTNLKGSGSTNARKILLPEEVDKLCSGSFCTLYPAFTGKAMAIYLATDIDDGTAEIDDNFIDTYENIYLMGNSDYWPHRQRAESGIDFIPKYYYIYGLGVFDSHDKNLTTPFGFTGINFGAIPIPGITDAPTGYRLQYATIANTNYRQYFASDSITTTNNNKFIVAPTGYMTAGPASQTIAPTPGILPQTYTGGTITTSTIVVLQPTYITITYYISYNLNNGAGTAPTKTTCYYNTTCSLPDMGVTTFYYAGKYLLGWSTSSTATTATYTTTAKNLSTTHAETITLYAVWSNCAAKTYQPGDGTVAANTCATCPTNYPNSVAGSDAITDCFTSCGAGTYVATANQACTNVGAGYYRAAHNVNYGSTSTRNQCSSGLTTIGYGAGADEAADCGRKLHAGDKVVYLRSAAKDSSKPSLRVKVGDTIFFGTLSTAIDNALKVNYGGTEYSVVDDSM